nr:hypothetical protein CFP56_67371 [Quercus suber]
MPLSGGATFVSSSQTDVATVATVSCEAFISENTDENDLFTEVKLVIAEVEKDVFRYVLSKGRIEGRDTVGALLFLIARVGDTGGGICSASSPS